MSEDEIRREVKAPSVSCSLSRKISDGNYGHVEAQVHMSSGTSQGLQSEQAAGEKIDDLFDQISEKLDEKLAEELHKHMYMQEAENAMDDALRLIQAGKHDEAKEKLENYISGGSDE